jgi:hypothetical protein
MIHFRGNDLRAPTLHNRGECQASTVILGTFCCFNAALSGLRLSLHDKIKKTPTNTDSNT